MTRYASNNYTYDPEWRRIKKVTASGTRYYVWDGGRLIAEYDQAGNRTTRYAYLPNDFSPTEVEINNVVYQVRSDHLGTPLELVNASNNVVWRAHYESFGKPVINDDVDGDGTHVEFNVRLPGQYFDQETGLSYNWHRYYDPAIGRYISSDPIGLLGGVNTFAYAGNNPLALIDPFGLMTIWWNGSNSWADIPDGPGWVPYIPGYGPKPDSGSSSCSGNGSGSSNSNTTSGHPDYSYRRQSSNSNSNSSGGSGGSNGSTGVGGTTGGFGPWGCTSTAGAGTGGLSGYFGCGIGMGAMSARYQWQNSWNIGDPTGLGVRFNVSFAAFGGAGSFSVFVTNTGANFNVATGNGSGGTANVTVGARGTRAY